MVTTGVASNKSKKTALILCVFLGYFGAHDFYLEKWGKGVIKALTCNFIGIGWICDTVKIATNCYLDFAGLPVVNGKNEDINRSITNDVSEKATNTTDHSTPAEMLEPSVNKSDSTYPFKDDDGRILRYSYYDVKVKGFDHQNFDIKKLELEKFVTFDFEPDNQYDPNAIAIFYDDQKIGYIPRNSLQSMVKKYSDGKEHQICGFISCINEELNEVQIALGFYSKVNNDLDVFKCRLCKTRAKDFMGNSRQENLELVDTGCPVELEYNDESETYLVCDDIGEELGEISKKQSAQIYEIIGDTEPFHAEVSELDTDDNCKIICTIEVWIKRINRISNKCN